jgi:hypothetical protein
MTMSSPKNTSAASTQANRSLLSRLFHHSHKEDPAAATTAAPETTPSSNLTPASAAAADESQAAYNHLMAKASTLSPEQFKEYLKQYGVEAEAEGRRRSEGQGFLARDAKGTLTVYPSMYDFVGGESQVKAQ